jgi:hypothetical protein
MGEPQFMQREIPAWFTERQTRHVAVSTRPFSTDPTREASAERQPD